MDILKPLTPEQEEAAERLDERELTFCNLWLTKDQHGMSNAECYNRSGYRASTENIAKSAASAMLNKWRVEQYIRTMRGETMRKVGMTLEYLDAQLMEMIEGNTVDVMRVKSLEELTAAQQRCIQSVKPTKFGIEVKLYPKSDMVRLAYQRFGALTDRKEITGKDGGAIEFSDISDVELNARIERLMNVTDDSDTV